MRPRPERPRGLIMWDPVGMKGKTQWALARGRAIHWTGAPSPKTIWDEDADLLVMDDFDKKPESGLWKGLMGGQANLRLRDLYFNKQVLWGKPAIYTCNVCPQLDEWDVANITVVQVYDKLF